MVSAVLTSPWLKDRIRSGLAKETRIWLMALGLWFFLEDLDRLSFTRSSWPNFSLGIFDWNRPEERTKIVFRGQTKVYNKQKNV
jgi:hypothetical protein